LKTLYHSIRPIVRLQVSSAWPVVIKTDPRVLVKDGVCTIATVCTALLVP